jgi:hypothetical protein
VSAAANGTAVPSLTDANIKGACGRDKITARAGRTVEPAKAVATMQRELAPVVSGARA